MANHGLLALSTMDGEDEIYYIVTHLGRILVSVMYEGFRRSRVTMWKGVTILSGLRTSSKGSSENELEV
jgi:hypothetical protein